MQVASKSRLADAAMARLFLCIGGVFGAHLVYCDQVFEALIYQSTFGVFLLGPVYDVFFLNRIVQRYNDWKIKSDLSEEDENSPRKKAPPFSLTHFTRQVLYAVWLGFLGVLLAIFLFKDTNDRLGLTLISSVAISLGVWIAGCCGNRRCSFLHALVASLSTSFFTIYWTDAHTLRSILVIAATSALNANRGRRWRFKNERALTTRQYMFFVSLFLTVFCIIWVGLSRSVFKREIGFVPKESNIRVQTVEVQTFFADYAFERRKPLHSVYPVAGHTIDYVPMVKFGASVSNVPWKGGKTSTKMNPPYTQLSNLYKKLNFDLNFFDDQQKIAEFIWLRYLTAFLTDYTRISLLNELPNRAQSEHAVLKVALWRIYLINSFDVDPFASDKELLQKCKPFKKRNELSPNMRKDKEKTDWAMASKTRACEILQTTLNPKMISSSH